MNHRHPCEIIKKYEAFQVQFENPTINSSLKYSVNNKINNNENYKNGNKINKNDINLTNNNLIKKIENNNVYTSNQLDNSINNNLLDLNGHFKPELLERNKLTCSFRKLKGSNAFFHRNSSLNFVNRSHFSAYNCFHNY